MLYPKCSVSDWQAFASLHRINVSNSWTLPAPGRKAIKLTTITFGFNIDTAIRQILHAACNPNLRCLTDSPPPEAHTLNHPGDMYPVKKLLFQ